MRHLHPFSTLAILISLSLMTVSCSQMQPAEQEESWEELLEADLNMLGHRNWILVVDKELSFITEEQVSGIEAFRSAADKILEGRTIKTLLHDEVFGMLDESSSLFRVLIIKTNCNLPYTSLFLQLDCAYWGPENEKLLRESMSGSLF